MNYANGGGRVFTTHYSYVWHISTAQEAAAPRGSWDTNPWTPEAPWSPDKNQVFNPAPNDTTSITATINQTFQKGKDFATWLQLTGATAVNGQISLLPDAARRRLAAGGERAPATSTFDTPERPPVRRPARDGAARLHLRHAAAPGDQPVRSRALHRLPRQHRHPRDPRARLLERQVLLQGRQRQRDPAHRAGARARVLAVRHRVVRDPAVVQRRRPAPPSRARAGSRATGAAGLTANCGSCPAGQTCGGGGVANIAARPTRAPARRRRAPPTRRAPAACRATAAAASRELRQLPDGHDVRRRRRVQPVWRAHGRQLHSEDVRGLCRGHVRRAERRVRRPDGRLQPLHPSGDVRRRRDTWHVRVAPLGVVHPEDVRELPDGHLRAAKRRVRRPHGRLQPVHAAGHVRRRRDARPVRQHRQLPQADLRGPGHHVRSGDATGAAASSASCGTACLR